VAYHIVATLPNGARKSIFNRDRSQVLELVTEFIRDGTLTTPWGKNVSTRQAYELRIFETKQPYNKKTSGSFDKFIAGKRNQYARFEEEVRKTLEVRRHRVFIVMPIQGDEYGSQSDRNVFLEFNARFAVLEELLREVGCVAIRIDREAPMGSLVERIKREIQRAAFVIADLTDERPSCYFECGYAEALGRPVIFVASRESVMAPGTATKIHFDIHQNVLFFGNHSELDSKVRDVIEKNEATLFPAPEENIWSRYLANSLSMSNVVYTGFTTVGDS
jgi:hypothetical protein